MSNFSSEPYKPESPHARALANPEFCSPVEVHCDVPDDMFRTILEIEASLGLRLGVDLYEGYPRMGFTRQTWQFIDGLYAKSSQTSLKELYASVNLQSENPRATYTVPLAGFGQAKKAIEGTFEYRAGLVTRGASTFKMLGRTGTTKLVANRFFTPVQSTASSGKKITDISPYKRYEQGSLGTIS